MRKHLIILAVAAGIMAGAFLAHAGNAGESQPRAARGTIRLLGSIQEIYGPVKFDHEMHKMIAGNCLTCHHQHPSNSKECASCHSINARIFKKSLTAGFISCENCHGKYDPATPGMPGLKTAYHQQCFKCHLDMMDMQLGPKNCSQECHKKRLKEGN